MDSFADAPVSLAEHRAGKSHDAKDWTPRDVLVELLRGIDRGEIKPGALLVAYRREDLSVGYSAAYPDQMEMLGILDAARYMLVRE